MSSTLHPLFGAVLQAAQVAPRDLCRVSRDAYTVMLCAHDWTFEYSDCSEAYGRGRAELDALLAVQRRIDRDCIVWNQHAPAGYRKARRTTPDDPAIARAIRECM